MQEIGLARSEQLLYLFDLDGPLQNDPPRTEVTTSHRPHAVLADVCHRVLEHARATLWAWAERSLPGKIHFFGRSISTRLRPEIELSAEIRGKTHHCRKRLAGSAAETRERAHRPFDDERLDLLRRELPARDHFPD